MALGWSHLSITSSRRLDLVPGQEGEAGANPARAGEAENAEKPAPWFWYLKAFRTEKGLGRCPLQKPGAASPEKALCGPGPPDSQVPPPPPPPFYTQCSRIPSGLRRAAALAYQGVWQFALGVFKNGRGAHASPCKRAGVKRVGFRSPQCRLEPQGSGGIQCFPSSPASSMSAPKKRGLLACGVARLVFTVSSSLGKSCFLIYHCSGDPQPPRETDGLFSAAQTRSPKKPSGRW